MYDVKPMQHNILKCKELAVMDDTFHPLQLTKEALEIEDENYVTSWAE
jgi:homogentisate 1,2-dioxygenase